MSWIVETLLKYHNWRNDVPNIKRNTPKEASPLRMGVLSAANINWPAIFDPIESHPGVVLSAVAARSLTKAQAQITKWQLDSTRAVGSYQELLDDPQIDAVYIPLPNGLHCEWAVKAMEAGKHVLIEKPIASNAEETERIRQCAESTGKVAVEAFHWRFHPAAHTVKAIVESGKYGNVQSVYSKMSLVGGAFADDDIRFNYQLAGGASMDLTYVFSATSYFASPNMTQCTYKVLEANPRLHGPDKRVDAAMKAKYAVEYPGRPTVTCTAEADLADPKLFGIIPKYWNMGPLVSVELERARIDFPNYPAPYITHTITITEKDDKGTLTSKKHNEKCFVGGPEWGEKGAKWWTTYRYQLEAFVDRVKGNSTGEEVKGPWISLDESVKLMELIDSVYEKAGLPKRGL